MSTPSFTEYLSIQGVLSFDAYAQSFVKWCENSNCFPQGISRTICSFSEDTFSCSVNPYREISVEMKAKYLLSCIQESGLRSHLFLKYKHLLTKEDIAYFEHDFCWQFVELLIPRPKIYLGDMEQCTWGELQNKFEKLLKLPALLGDKTDDFLENFKVFVSHIPQKLGEKKDEYGYILLEDISHEIKDVGVVIFNKTRITQEVLFFQLGR